MNVEHEEPGRLKIFLKKDDMRQLDITFDQMDYNDAKTRRVLWTILSDVGAASSFIVTGSKLLIEVFPASDSGCIIYFTLLKKEQEIHRRLKLKKQNLQPAIFEFTNTEDLLSAFSMLYKDARKRVERSNLYRFQDKYRLIVFLKQAHQVSTLAMLNEYGKNIGQTSAQIAYTQEHGCLLAENNAVETVGRHFAMH